jgi:hypothetical protein
VAPRARRRNLGRGSASSTGVRAADGSSRGGCRTGARVRFGRSAGARAGGFGRGASSESAGGGGSSELGAGDRRARRARTRGLESASGTESEDARAARLPEEGSRGRGAGGAWCAYAGGTVWRASSSGDAIVSSVARIRFAVSLVITGAMRASSAPKNNELEGVLVAVCCLVGAACGRGLAGAMGRDNERELSKGGAGAGADGGGLAAAAGCCGVLLSSEEVSRARRRFGTR